MELDKIISGDSAVILQSFPPDCIDLSIQSPPYDGIRIYNGYSFDFETIARQLFRVTKAGGVVVWVVGDETKNGSESGTSFRQALYFMQCGFILNDTMIYQKENPIPQFKSTRYTNAFEYMFIFSRGKPKTFNPIKEPSRSFGRVDKNYKGQRFANGIHNTKEVKQVRKEKLLTNIWIYDAANDIERIKNHPAQFPMSLASDHIKTWSNECDVVLDCFSGSGTTLKMAKLLNRHYIGIDTSVEYVALANERLAQSKRGLTQREPDGGKSAKK
jgi:site-specific DNA-methyltransferase (adenine-specific)